MIDQLQQELNELFRGSEGHYIVKVLCGILREQESRIAALELRTSMPKLEDIFP